MSYQVIGKYLSFNKGWGNLFAGAIFGMVLLLSKCNSNQTLYQRTNLNQQSYNLTQCQNDTVLSLTSSNLTVEQNRSQSSHLMNEPSVFSNSFKIKFHNKMLLEDLQRKYLKNSEKSSNIYYQVNWIKEFRLVFCDLKQNSWFDNWYRYETIFLP